MPPKKLKAEEGDEERGVQFSKAESSIIESWSETRGRPSEIHKILPSR